MKRSVKYPCLLVRRTDERLYDLVVLPVEDTRPMGPNDVMDEEERESRMFESKPLIVLRT